MPCPLAAALTAFLLVGSAACAAERPAGPPNVVFMMARRKVRSSGA